MIDSEWECIVEELQYLKYRYNCWKLAHDKGFGYFANGDSIDKVSDYTERMFIEELELLRERMLDFPPRDNLLS